MHHIPHILILDDDPLALQTLEIALSPQYQVIGFGSPEAAEAHLSHHQVGLAILDLNLGEQSGLEILKRWKKKFPDLEMIFCSGETRVDRAIQCLRSGASDYVTKPIDKANLRFIVDRTLEKSFLRQKVETMTPMIHPHPVEFIGESPSMKKIVEKLHRLRNQHDLNVMILGESGTGKEVIARYLHQQEHSQKRPFVVVNMPAIPATLVEAELFGVEKGAYTDAKASRAGKFELANHGDIFLDEIGDLHIDVQAKILRTLQIVIF